MKLVVIIPALNEEKTISSVIQQIPRSIPGIDSTEVVVIDDGSTDRTAELARVAGARVLTSPSNEGVGAALARGLDAALRLGADLIVNMDADGQFNPEDIPSLIGPILHEGYGFVTCTRFAHPEDVRGVPWAKRVGNRVLARILNWVIGKRFTDVSCGFRAYSRDAALRLNLFGRFSYTHESIIDLAAKKIPMTEVPLRVRSVREFGRSRVAHSLPRYALRAGAIIIRSLRDTRPLQFFGTIGLVVLLLGVALGLLVFVFWCFTGHTTPFRSVLIGSGAFLTLGFLLCVLALLADLMGRIRKSTDELLYLQRKADYDRSSGDPPQPLPDEFLRPGARRK